MLVKTFQDTLMKNPLSLYTLTAIIVIALAAPAAGCALFLKYRNSTSNNASGSVYDPSSTEFVSETTTEASDVSGGLVILIDPGHGGYDPGKVSTTGSDRVDEKDINLAIATKLRDELCNMGYQVHMTRDSDTSLNSSDATHKKTSDLRARIDIAEDIDADLLLSIHQNSYSSEDVHGAQVFYYSTSDSGKALAECIQSHLISDAAPSNTRTAKGNSEYMILTDSPCTSVIIECGFLSNRAECANLCTDDYQLSIANAIANAVYEWESQR